MKTLILILSLFTFLSELQAKVLTVSNRPGASAQYKDVPSAIAAAAAGDTIYIQGSETSYGNFTIDKKLTVIGTGHNPKKENALITKLWAIEVKNSAASGSSLIGLKIYAISAPYRNEIKDVMIKRCDIQNIDVQVANNWKFENNILGTLKLGTTSNNSIIRNNIIIGVLRSTNGSVITNNIFLVGGGILTPFQTLSAPLLKIIFFTAYLPKGPITQLSTTTSPFQVLIQHYLTAQIVAT
jgi:hypothetical protein